jgi:hypothetical protein
MIAAPDRRNAPFYFVDGPFCEIGFHRFGGSSCLVIALIE